MGTFHQRNADLEPSILVGWTAGLLRVWPEESNEPIRAGGGFAVHAAAERSHLVERMAS
jgi:hypothetical protein